MSKAKLAIFAIALLVTAAAIATGFLVWQKSQKVSQPGLTSTPVAPAEDKQVDYKDESGFSFKHPEGVAVSDITPDDNLHYTLLELSKDGKKMTVSVRDTKYKTIDEWLKSSSDVASDATLVGALTLGGIPAKQYTADNKFWTVAIDKGVIYLVESIKDKGFWDKAHDLLVSSFSFEKPQEGTTNGASPDNNAVYEPEDTVE